MPFSEAQSYQVLNTNIKNIQTPLTSAAIEKLRSSDVVCLSGTIYTARDQAHKLIVEMIEKGKKLPFDISGQIIYYCGPTEPGYKGHAGSCGPTTSSRMDKYVPALLKLGLKGMIGKGKRSPEVVKSIMANRAIYFAAPAGMGALVGKSVVRRELVAFKELGPEAVYRFEIKDMLLVVVNDIKGNNLYRF